MRHFYCNWRVKQNLPVLAGPDSWPPLTLSGLASVSCSEWDRMVMVYFHHRETVQYTSTHHCCFIFHCRLHPLALGGINHLSLHTAKTCSDNRGNAKCVYHNTLTLDDNPSLTENSTQNVSALQDFEEDFSEVVLTIIKVATFYGL